jgi:hypothetical protein
MTIKIKTPDEHIPIYFPIFKRNAVEKTGKKYRFRVDSSWAQHRDIKKIGLRTAGLTYTSLITSCEVRTEGTSPRMVYFSGEESIPKFFDKIQSDSYFGTIFSYTYNDGLGELTLMNSSDTDDIVIVPTNSVNFSDFLNQPRFGRITIRHMTTSYVTMLLLHNVWDRQNLYLHANFNNGNVVCRMPYMQEIPTRFYRFDNKIYVEVWFSTNGANEIDLQHDFFIELDLYQF